MTSHHSRMQTNERTTMLRAFSKLSAGAERISGELGSRQPDLWHLEARGGKPQRRRIHPRHVWKWILDPNAHTEKLIWEDRAVYLGLFLQTNSIKAHLSSAKCNLLVFNALENVMSMLYCLEIVEEIRLLMSNHYLPPLPHIKQFFVHEEYFKINLQKYKTN